MSSPVKLCHPQWGHLYTVGFPVMMKILFAPSGDQVDGKKFTSGAFPGKTYRQPGRGAEQLVHVQF